MNMSPFVSLHVSTQKWLKNVDPVKVTCVEIPTQPVSLQVFHLYQGAERTPESALSYLKERRRRETLSPT